MSIANHATTEGTARYRDRFPDAAEGHFREREQLWLSSIGIGTYLGNADDQTDLAYAETVARAVGLGANVIDTAANYRFQRSERAIGTALQELTGKQGFSRDELVICTKAATCRLTARLQGMFVATWKKLSSNLASRVLKISQPGVIA